MSADQSQKIVEAVRDWLASFVIELNLCPFAKRALLGEQIRFAVALSDSPQQLLMSLQDELGLLSDTPEIETTLLIHPNILQDFDDYNDFLDLVDALIEEEGYAGEFQVASFHPDYRFEGTAANAAENYSNRSPYPLMHILREASVEREVEHYPSIEKVPLRNIELLRELGVTRIRSILHIDD